MEGGAGWLAFVLDRLAREDEYRPRASDLDPVEWVKSGNGAHRLRGQRGVRSATSSTASGRPRFAYASDYPHEVDALKAEEEIDELAHYPGLTDDDKAAVLGGNAKRFFGV